MMHDQYEVGEISKINTSDNTIAATIQHADSDNPYRIAVIPGGNKAYITNMAVTPGLVSVLDLTDNTFSDAIEVQTQPGGVAILDLSE